MSGRFLRFAFLLVLGVAAPQAAWSQRALSLSSANPRAHEFLRLIIPTANRPPQGGTFDVIDSRETRMSMQGNRIDVQFKLVSLGFETLPPGDADIVLGAFPAGTYEVVVQWRSDNSALQEFGRLSFSVLDRRDGEPLGNITDIWYDPAEAGWGINLIHHGSGKVFATWFVYGPDRAPIWYVVSDGKWSPSTFLAWGYDYTGPIYRTSGQPYTQCMTPSETCAPTFIPSVSIQQVGQLTLSYSQEYSSVAYLDMTIDGRRFQKKIRRQGF